MGLEWVNYALTRMWKLSPRGLGPTPRGYNMSAIMQHDYVQLTKATHKKYNYYRQYLAVDRVQLYGAFALSLHDGEKQPYVELVRGAMGREKGEGEGREWTVEVDGTMGLDEQDEVVQRAIRERLPPGFKLFLNSEYKLGGTPKAEKRRLGKDDKRRAREEAAEKAEEP